MPTIEELAKQFGGVKVDTPRGLPQGQDIGQIAKQFGGVQVQPKQEKPGLLKSLAVGAISPFAKATVTATNVIRGTGRIAKGLGQLATGDKEKAFRSFASAGEATSEKIPLLGEVKPIGSTAEALGVGAEIGSFFIGGSGLSQIGKQTLKGLVKQGAKEGIKFGFLGGLTGGAGLAAQQEDITPEDFFKQTMTGAFAGAGLGGVLGAVTPLAGNIFRRINNIIRKEPVVPTAVTRGLGRASERVKTVTQKRATLKTQPVKIQNAVNAGVDLPRVQFIDNLSGADKASANKMLSLLEKNKAGDITARSISEAGNTALEPVKFIQQLRKKAGTEIGELVRNLPDEKLSIADISDSFIDDMTNAGVKMNADGQLNFKNSRLAGAKSATERRQLKDTWKFLKPTKKGIIEKKPLQIHIQRQKLFDDLQLAKGQQLFSSNTKRMLNKVRSNLNTPLDSVSSQYTTLNRQFAESTSVVDDFFRLIGKQWKGADSELLALRSGEVGRRIKGNASAVPLKVFNTIDDVARRNGFKSDKNVLNQFLFNDLLEDIFGTTQTTGIEGSVGRGLGKAEFGASVGQQLARGRALGAVAETIGKVSQVFTPTEQEQMKALRALLGVKRGL